MLPISSTPSALPRVARSIKATAVVAIAADGDALSGEWQQAAQGGRRRSHQTLDGELFKDEQAVGDYLAVAGESTVILPGQIISVFA